jgi:hypothetical protein
MQVNLPMRTPSERGTARVRGVARYAPGVDDLPESLYVAEGDLRFAPTELTRGPWSVDAQHGGAPASLLGGLIEDYEPSGTRVARLTVELLRPVPLTPLDVRIETVRQGRKVQIVQASLFSEDTEVVRATGLRIRSAPLEVADPAPERVPALGKPPESTRLTEDVLFIRAFDVRRERDWHTEGLGPQVVWFRLRVPVVAGVAARPLQRLAAAADFPNGISSVVPWDAGWVFINPDVTIHVARPPRGEWIGLDARTVPGGDGVGMAEAALFDEHGRVGRSTQSLLFDKPGPA